MGKEPKADVIKKKITIAKGKVRVMNFHQLMNIITWENNLVLHPI